MLIFIYIVNANLMKLLQVSLDALIAMYYNCTVKTCYTEIGKQSLVLFSCTYWPWKRTAFHSRCNISLNNIVTDLADIQVHIPLIHITHTLPNCTIATCFITFFCTNV